jgi:3-hydroxyacyl-[acyl-carrier-protein] dehydratase
MRTVTRSFAVADSQPVFAGHFPDNPILPGVFLLAFARATLAEAAGRPCRIAGIQRQKFLVPVLPAHTVRVECDFPGVSEGPVSVPCRFLNQDGALVSQADLLVEFLP